MKYLLMTSLISSSILLILSCTSSDVSSLSPHVDATIVPHCEKRICHIIEPSDPEPSSSRCGSATLMFDGEFLIICLDSGEEILDFIGWAPMNHDTYYTDFWSVAIRGHCLYLQPHDDLRDDISLHGYRLDITICTSPYDLEQISS